MIQMVGTDHTLAPVNVRSFFSFTKEENIQFMTQIQIDLKADGVLLLSTCNRMELWVSTDREEPDNLLHEICLFKDVKEEVEVEPEPVRTGIKSRSQMSLVLGRK